MHRNILLFKADNQPGILALVTGAVAELGANIQHLHQFVDNSNNKFFMRIEFKGDVDKQQLFRSIKPQIASNAKLAFANNERKKLLVLGSKEHHCVSDILARCKFGEFNADVPALISNHPDLELVANTYNVPFHHCSHEGLSREQHEEKMLRLIYSFDYDFVVLAKYMRILTPKFVEQFNQQLINIHHSFLPAFIGARPYHQAFERGVKIIGATSHFVNNVLDGGPIIAQRVISVNHSHSPQDMALAGMEVEKQTLIAALRLVMESRVFINDNKTVIFD